MRNVEVFQIEIKGFYNYLTDLIVALCFHKKYNNKCNRLFGGKQKVP